MKTTSITSLAFLVGIMMFMPGMADKPTVILVMSDDQGWTQTGLILVNEVCCFVFSVETGNTE